MAAEVGQKEGTDIGNKWSVVYSAIRSIERNHLYLTAILLLASFIRLYRLTDVPNGFSADEASYGYHGFSILKTGRDRFGEFLPLFVDNFGDSIEASYVYLTVPSIAIFGLGEFATRLPAALAGILTVFVLFKLTREAFNERIALFASLLLAISPWHIHVSRYAERSLLLPLFFCLGLFFFIKSRREPRCIYWSAIVFSLSLYTYASERVFVPLFLMGLCVLFFGELWQARRKTLVAFALFLILAVRAAWHWVSPEGMARAQLLLTFSIADWIENYASYLSPGFLFFEGDPNIRHSLADMGQLHLFELVTLAAGLVFLLRKRSRQNNLFWLWLFLYPLPAAFIEPSHAIRTVVGIPLFALVSGCGLQQLTEVCRGRWRSLFSAVMIVAVSLSFFRYCEEYFEEYPKYGALRWLYGMKETFTYSLRAPYASVYISDQLFLPHIFVLFYTQYPPAEYQRRPLRGVRQGNWVYTDFSFGRYHVDSLPDILAGECDNSLLIAFAYEAEGIEESASYKRVHAIDIPDGRRLIELFECRDDRGR